MANHINDTYMTVTEENGILSLVWKKETIGLTDEDFKYEALKFIEIVKKHKNKYILVDMRNFNFQLSNDVIEWRNKNIITAYNKVGVNKFAFVSEIPAVKQDNPENTFQTKTFSSVELSLIHI